MQNSAQNLRPRPAPAGDVGVRRSRAQPFDCLTDVRPNMTDNPSAKRPEPLVTEAARAMRLRRTRTEKLAIGSLDDEHLTVAAQYNPKEIQLEKQIPWQSHN